MFVVYSVCMLIYVIYTEALQLLLVFHLKDIDIFSQVIDC